jgi:hypothetical protein
MKQPSYIHGHERHQAQQLNQKTKMKKNSNNRVTILISRVANGINSRVARAAVLLTLLVLPSIPLFAAQAQDARRGKLVSTTTATSVAQSSDSDFLMPTMATNGITARIQSDLETVKNKIDAAVKSLQEAAASNQVQRAMSVSNVATQIRSLASSDLGDGSALVRETDKLIAKMRTQISQGRNLSADPREEAREAYAQGLLTLEPELSRLIDRRTSVARVRSELLRQASALESRARAIAWLEDADQMKVASKALEDALTEALAFAGRIDALITQLGRGQPLAIE